MVGVIIVGAVSKNQLGVPLADETRNCAAVFECERTSFQDAGDHVLFIGRVLKMADLSAAPLVFHGGHYHMLGEVL